MASDLTTRIEKAAELLAVKPESLMESLEKQGIKNDSTGVALLEASSTSLDDVIGLINCHHQDKKSTIKLQVRAAASILKGEDPFKKEVEEKKPLKQESSVQTVFNVVKAIQPISQWNDRDLLEKYAQSRDHDIEQELNRRAKQQNFVVLKQGKFEPGKEEIDINTTLDLLKSARKRTNPSMISVKGAVIPVYRITELNLEDRIIDLCPICGETLYKGYCEKCSSGFEGIGDDERAYIALIVDSDNFNSSSHSDRKAVITSAMKGLDDLKKTWPSIIKTFDELKFENRLPRLRIVANRPSKADPFFQNGNRTFGHREL